MKSQLPNALASAWVGSGGQMGILGENLRPGFKWTLKQRPVLTQCYDSIKRPQNRTSAHALIGSEGYRKVRHKNKE